MRLLHTIEIGRWTADDPFVRCAEIVMRQIDALESIRKGKADEGIALLRQAAATETDEASEPILTVASNGTNRPSLDERQRSAPSMASQKPRPPHAYMVPLSPAATHREDRPAPV
jgi:hypothetical protein